MLPSIVIDMTPPIRTELTTVARVKDRLGVVSSTDDGILAGLIRSASAAAERFCSRPFARRIVQEKLAGYDSIYLMLGRTPVINVASVTYRGDGLTGYEIADRDAGLLFRENGWLWTAGFMSGITLERAPGSEFPDYTASYVAGYLLPGDDLTAALITAASSDASFNTTSSDFALLSSGDVFETSGFEQGANNGRFTVTSRTASKIAVAEGLVTEATSTGSKTIAVRTLPEDIEEAVLVTVRDWYSAKGRDSQIASKTIGDLSITYRQQVGGEDGPRALPFDAQALLGPWVRSA